MDSVLLHDMRNLGFRLSLLLGNLEEHYGDPDFKRSVVDVLHGTLTTLETSLERWSARKEAVLVKVSLDLSDLVSEVLRRARLRDGSRPAGTRVETDVRDVPAVWGDPYYLEEALSSVFLNALEAAGPSGLVRVRTSAEGRVRRWSAVDVEDDGPGMTAEFVRDSLFRPFRSTKPEGVGLGLYTARRILSAHGGKVTVTSRPGEGTTVRVLLPATDEKQ